MRLPHQQQVPRGLVIPYGLYSHWIPLKVVIRQLVDSGISFTVAGTKEIIADLQELNANGEFKKLKDVELVEVFSEAPIFTSSRAPCDLAVTMGEEFFNHPSLMQKLVAQKSSGLGPTFVLSDMFLYWSQDIADQLEIPRYQFYPSPTTCAHLFQHCFTAFLKGWYPQNPNETKRNEMVDIPGLHRLRARELPESVYTAPDFGRLVSDYFPKAAGHLINSFEQYEEEEVLALRNQVPHAKVLLIGPIMYLPTLSSGSELRQEATEREKCLNFLDSKTATSVLYICFGGAWRLPPPTITELARGLELSEVPFLWVLPPPVDSPSTWDVSESLPAGFLSRTQGRGLICTTWAPQREILEHPSVCCFMSHCGWNSCMEGMDAVVPMIAWPIGAEQKMNARFFVSAAKVAMDINNAVEDEFTGEELANTVRLVMASSANNELRQNMQELHRKARAAVAEDGSSSKALLTFLGDVKALRSTRMQH